MTDATEVRLLYVTTDGPDEARSIGRTLVEERLVACVNILDPMTSFYRWEGSVQEGEETVLIAKTRAELVDSATGRIVALHSFDCPCVVALPLAGGNPGFLGWIAAETA